MDARRRLGAAGEQLAERHLARAGYRVLDRNFRTRIGELDLVATNATTLVFCEVKCRVGGGDSGPPTPLEAVGPQKRRRLRRMAREWLASRAPRLGGWQGDEIRFDAIGVTLSAHGEPIVLEHVPDAF
jgi:putative endonuclease